MLLSKKRKFLPELYSSHQGVHLTTYLPWGSHNNEGNLQNYFNKIVWRAEILLRKEYGDDFTNRFLDPIRNAFSELNFENYGVGTTLAIFRTPRFLRIKPIPVSTHPVSVVSSSFHLKPVINWLQWDREYMVLSLRENRAELFEGSLSSLKKIDSLSLSLNPSDHPMENYYKSVHTDIGITKWVDSWLRDTIQDERKLLFLNGSPQMIDTFRALSTYTDLAPEAHDVRTEYITHANLQNKLRDSVLNISRNEINREVKQLEKNFNLGRVLTDLPSIAKKTVRGEISKLFVAEDSSHWGVLCKREGDLSINSQQMDCVDDDILDDLAETTLRHGKKVFVVPRHMLPNGASAAAITKRPKLITNRPTIDSHLMVAS